MDDLFFLAGFVGIFPTFNEYMDSERRSVLTPVEKAFYATPADPVVARGPPLFDVTPISSPRGIAFKKYKQTDSHI